MREDGIYQSASAISNFLETLEEMSVPESNKEAIRQLLTDLRAEGLSKKRQLRYMDSWRTLLRHIEWDLQDPSKDKLKELVTEINEGYFGDREEKMSPYTRRDFKYAIKKLYEHMEGVDYDELLSWMRIGIRSNEKTNITPEKYPKPYIVERMAKKAQNIRNELFIRILWGSGGRIGEVLPIKWKDTVIFPHKGNQIVKLFVQGKEGKRETVPIACGELARKWRQEQDGSRDSYVFSHLNDPEHLISHTIVCKYLRRMKKRANIPEHIEVSPQKFRRGRACHLARYKEVDALKLRKIFGWDDLETARRYIRASRSDVDSTVFEIDQGHSKGRPEESISNPALVKKRHDGVSMGKKAGVKPLTEFS